MFGGTLFGHWFRLTPSVHIVNAVNGSTLGVDDRCLIISYSSCICRPLVRMSLFK